MPTDFAIQTLPFIAQATPDIAPVAPASYFATNLPDGKPLLQVSGTADPKKSLYPGALFCPGISGKATPRPIQPNTGNVALSFSACLSSGGHVQESDLLIVQNGLMFPANLQRVLATGEIDVGGWTDSGIPHLGALAVGVWHRIRIVYQFTAKTIQMLSYECDGVVNAIAGSIGTFPATKSTWESGAYIQLQMGQFPTGAAWAQMVDDFQLEWW